MWDIQDNFKTTPTKKIAEVQVGKGVTLMTILKSPQDRTGINIQETGVQVIEGMHQVTPCTIVKKRILVITQIILEITRTVTLLEDIRQVILLGIKRKLRNISQNTGTVMEEKEAIMKRTGTSGILITMAAVRTFLKENIMTEKRFVVSMPCAMEIQLTLNSSNLQGK